jgi:hypothetical protein
MYNNLPAMGGLNESLFVAVRENGRLVFITRAINFLI